MADADKNGSTGWREDDNWGAGERADGSIAIYTEEEARLLRIQRDAEEKAFAALLDDDASAPLATTTTRVSVSESAARRIATILAGEGANAMLRVSVEGGGCSGFQYKFDVERERAEDDLVIVRNGAVVLVDPVSVNYLEGAEIDYVDDLIGASFRVNNPQATASCGCGTSFAL